MTLSEVASFIAVFVALYSIVSQRRYVSSQADSNNVDTAIKLRREMQKDRDETRREYDELQDHFKKLEVSLSSAQKIISDSAVELDNVERKMSQLDLMFNSLLKGAWLLVAQVKRYGKEPDYLPPREYVTGPIVKENDSQ